jgi:hypothetical protein
MYAIERALSVKAVIDLLCGHFDKTEWGLTKGILAGAFGNPERVESGEGVHKVKGADLAAAHEPHARRRGAPRVPGHVFPARRVRHVRADESASSVFAPFRAETLKLASKVNIEETAEPYCRVVRCGAMDKLADPAMREALAQAQRDDVRAATAVTRKAQEGLDAWRDLFDELIASYSDGTLSTYLLPNDEPKKPHTARGYPEAWLRDIGFD